MIISKKKCWSYSVGEWGSKVRVAELRAAKGNLYVFWTGGSGKQRMRSLGHRDKERAKKEAKRIAHSFLNEADQGPAAREPLTLGHLIDLYLNNGLHGRSQEYQKEQARKLRLIEEFYGTHRDVESLSRSDVDRFVHARRTGKFGSKQGRERGGVRMGTIWHDLVALKIALNWAVGHRVRGGRRLLPDNPLKTVTIPKDPSPARPVAGLERYQALKKVAPQFDWRFELALDLAYATGHRIGSILRLSWEDVDLSASPHAPHGMIRWRGEYDKVGNEHITPMNQIAHDALTRARKRVPGIGGAWIFPSPKDPAAPLDRHLASDYFRKAEAAAEITHVRGGGWHAFRRGWATARKQYPLKDVAEAGGWKDTASLLQCYTHADPQTVLQVVSGERGAVRLDASES